MGRRTYYDTTGSTFEALQLGERTVNNAPNPKVEMDAPAPPMTEEQLLEKVPNAVESNTFENNNNCAADFNSEGITRREKLAKLQKSTIFDGALMTPEEQAGNSDSRSKRWPWQTKAMTSQIFFDDPRVQQQERRQSKNNIWDQTEPAVSDEPVSDNCNHLQQRQSGPWPWQERAGQSQIFGGEVVNDSGTPSKQRSYRNSGHVFPWDQQISLGLWPSGENSRNKNANSRPNASQAQERTLTGGQDRDNNQSAQSRYQMDFQTPSSPSTGQVLMPSAGKIADTGNHLSLREN